MKASRFSEEQIIAVLREEVAGASWLNLVESWFAALTAATANSKTPAAVISNPTSGIAGPLSGPKPPTKPSTPSPDFVNVLQIQDTRAVVVSVNW